MGKNIKIASSLIAIGLFLTLGFSNCSKVQVADITQDPSATKTAANDTNGGNTNATPDVIIPGLSGKTITASSDLKLSGNQLDIVLVLDDSGSMKDDSLQLASRLSNFVQMLGNSGIDWQMCWTDTDLANDGSPLPWVFTNSNTNPANKTIINTGINNFAQVFTDTISAVNFGSASGDERGVATLRRLVERKIQHNCLRPGAAMTSITISDEDERSAGGNMNLNQYQPIQDIDKPDQLLLAISNVGQIGRYVANSIIVKPGDSSCLNQQSANGAKYGTFYDQVSQLTQGGVGSICESDYSSHMNLFFDRVSTNINSVKLICTPVAGSLVVNVNQPVGNYAYHLDGTSLIFDLKTTDTFHVDVKYTCK